VADAITYVTPSLWALPAAASAAGVLTDYYNQQSVMGMALSHHRIEALQALIAENKPLSQRKNTLWVCRITGLQYTWQWPQLKSPYFQKMLKTVR